MASNPCLSHYFISGGSPGPGLPAAASLVCLSFPHLLEAVGTIGPSQGFLSTFLRQVTRGGSRPFMAGHSADELFFPRVAAAKLLVKSLEFDCLG